ncbi:MAG: acyl-CoA thioesterase II [Bacteroidetes bacterium]|nr:MAG: acyl-CoA thioesterase II [Bacteroidota bacterium]
MKPISELLEVLALNRLDGYQFQGISKDIGSKRVFGGQVLAQALYAAAQTVEPQRQCHSLHAYFVLPGDLKSPILFEVDDIRDGGSFSTRRVIASQYGRAIFILAASFQLDQPGLDHQIEMLNVPPPESLASDWQLVQQLDEPWRSRLSRFFSEDRPIEFKPVELINPLEPGHRPPFRHVWFRANGRLPDEPAMHRAVLAYASDYNLLVTALLPHNVSFLTHQVKMASIDHAMWFHREFRADDWLLYALDSPSASGSRGFCRGSIFTRSGKLVASVTQEGLIRVVGGKEGSA